jgi:hypothetical protein
MRAMSSHSTAPTATNISTKFRPKIDDEQNDEEDERQRIEHVDDDASSPCIDAPAEDSPPSAP